MFHLPWSEVVLKVLLPGSAGLAVLLFHMVPDGLRAEQKAFTAHLTTVIKRLVNIQCGEVLSLITFITINAHFTYLEMLFTLLNNIF